MKKKIILIISCFTLGLWAAAQSLSPAVIAADGTQNYTETLSLEWTLGELTVGSIHTENGMLTEGFHQPLLKITEIPGSQNTNGKITAGPEANNVYTEGLISDFKIDAWPNPVHSRLTVKIQAETDDEVILELFDGMGRSLNSKSIFFPFDLIELDLTENPSGIYFLKFNKKDGTFIKTFLIEVI